ncbi:MAG: hypothetical protein HY699_03070 [Deltaproteobacteria bacterium]|nr:hypothetical protein [Deltaproteobacteria bacterium]
MTGAGEAKQMLGVIWAAMLAAVATYAAVAFLIIDEIEAPVAESPAWLRYAFSAFAVLLGGLSLWWRRRLFAAGTITPEQQRTHAIVIWALCEAVALCGFVLGFVTHDFDEFSPFALAAAALLILHRPANLPRQAGAETA